MSDENAELQTWIEPDLEARVVACVLGEASAFEAAELERIIVEKPELGIFKRRIEAVNGLVKAASRIETDPMRLDEARRQKLLETLGGKEAAPKPAVVAMPQRKAEEGWRFTFGTAIGIAACLMVMAFLWSISLPMYSSVQVKAGLLKKLNEEKQAELAAREKHDVEMSVPATAPQSLAMPAGAPVARLAALDSLKAWANKSKDEETEAPAVTNATAGNVEFGAGNVMANLAKRSNVQQSLADAKKEASADQAQQLGAQEPTAQASAQLAQADATDQNGASPQVEMQQAQAGKPAMQEAAQESQNAEQQAAQDSQAATPALPQAPQALQQAQGAVSLAARDSDDEKQAPAQEARAMASLNTEENASAQTSGGAKRLEDKERQTSVNDSQAEAAEASKTINLSGANAFTGATIINGGTVETKSGAGELNIQNGAAAATGIAGVAMASGAAGGGQAQAAQATNDDTFTAAPAGVPAPGGGTISSPKNTTVEVTAGMTSIPITVPIPTAKAAARADMALVPTAQAAAGQEQVLVPSDEAQAALPAQAEAAAAPMVQQAPQQFQHGIAQNDKAEAMPAVPASAVKQAQQLQRAEDRIGGLVQNEASKLASVAATENSISNNQPTITSGDQISNARIRYGSPIQSFVFNGLKGGDLPVLGHVFRGKTELAVQPAENEISAKDQPYSTFSLHVSDVSFLLAQAALARGEIPDPASIRPEEFYNAFDYGDPAPAPNEKIACHIEQAAHPVLQQRNLVRIAMKVAATGRGAGQPLRLTVLMDTSGSMEREDRAASVRKAMQVLTSLLGPDDEITLIGFARQPRLLAEAVKGDQAGSLADIVAHTPSEGGTNMEEAIKTASELAQRHFKAGGQNRVVMLTDGAANLGDANPARLSKLVEQLRQKGVSFDGCGVGADGLNDDVLEALTRKGGGRYYFLNKPEDADEGFARQLAGAFRPAAENVKMQVRFNPSRVGNYRLIGFEKHLLKQEDFRNDKVTAAQLAAEEAAVALYQVQVLPEGEGELGEVFVRFRDPANGRMIEQSWTIPYNAEAPALEKASPSMQLAAMASFVAEKLRGGALADALDLDSLAPVVAQVRSHYAQQTRVQQLVAMFEQVRRMGGRK